ncbi:helix-turn-helix transcriptional regulator [Paenirhodobacter ferrireducens]|uniref:helix-turn-helix transcriptional regulator n=1 Tax=Paenirhodobacter ferrireducens TaxID=1215032 RepID=UPI0013E3B22E|nr:helix-turn-helix transcriptional regulator [Sinirhodobacter ferrireducens]
MNRVRSSSDRQDRERQAELIDLIYAAMLGEQDWQRFLDELVCGIPSGKAAMQMFNTQRPDESGVALQAGFDTPAIDDYGAHFCGVNVLQQSLALRRDGFGYADTELVPTDQLRASEIFNDWLRPNGIQSSAGLKLGTEGAWNFSLTLMSERNDDLIRREMARRLTELAPHLHRATQFYQRQGTVAPDSLEARLMGSSALGVIVLGRDCAIQTMNARAEAFLRQRQAPFRVQRQRLLMRDGGVEAQVKSMLSPAYRGPDMMTLALPGVRLTLIRLARQGISLLFQGISLIVLIDGLDTTELFDEEVFALEYRLTPAERRAARGIVAGLSPAEISHQAELSRETIRAQIRSLYQKTGARSQADILRLARLRLTR